jgi:hypothetical protein
MSARIDETARSFAMKVIGPAMLAARMGSNAQPSGKCSTLLVLVALAWLPFPAHADSDVGVCRGVDFDVKRPLQVARISTRPHVNFIKGSDEDAACPADKEICRRQAYLVPGDIVLNGRVQGAFTCVSYQSFHTRKQNWTTGWLPTKSLAPIEPISSSKASDWIGDWSHPGGTVSISHSSGGKLRIEGEHTYPAAQNVHSGVLGAEVAPQQGMIAFVDDGSIPFDQAEDGQCIVRMQRVGTWLLVEDNRQCGGSMVTFTGLYRRN